MAGFSEITLKLKEMYQMITLGGDAELELVDSLDPFSEGIVFSVRPPKKSWKNISNLSGGEKVSVWTFSIVLELQCNADLFVVHN
jgi:structural maintenance of chromosome 4